MNKNLQSQNQLNPFTSFINKFCNNYRIYPLRPIFRLINHNKTPISILYLYLYLP